MGRFINADGYASTGQGLLGNNMFAYCSNNPITFSDPYGMWTMGISIGANLILLLGASVSIGVFWDDNGNIEFQWSYSVPGVNDTMTVGLLSAGVGISFQCTEADTVSDLYGYASVYGASAGPALYAGGDLISFSNASDLDGEINGWQLNSGIGIGLDIHVSETYTQGIGKKQRNNTGKSSKEKYYRAKLDRIMEDRFSY